MKSPKQILYFLILLISAILIQTSEIKSCTRVVYQGFSENAPVKKLGLTKGEIYSGNTAGKFIETPAFKFEGL